MIYLVTSRESEYNWEDLATEDIVEANFDEFVNWCNGQSLINFDTETLVIKNNPNQHTERQLLVMQFGAIDKSVQWIIDMISLHHKWVKVIKRILQDPKITFIIHYATFDYVVVKAQLGIDIAEIHDTCLMSKILNTGIDTIDGYHSLAGCLKRFFDIDISKEEQKTFTGDILTKDQILYAAVDVLMLYDLLIKLKALLDSWGLWYLYSEVERKVLRVYGKMELTPMRFDKIHWNTIAGDFIRERNQLEIDLNAEVLKDPKLVAHLKNSQQIIKDVLIQPKDELKINWGSVTDKNLVLKKLVPALPDTVKTKPELKTWFKENISTLTADEVSVLTMYFERSYDKLTLLVFGKERQWLQDVGLFIPEGTNLINWGSNIHKLYIFQFYYPKLTDTNAKSLNTITKNSLINIFKKFSAANKNVTTYGEEFIERYVNKDDMIAPTGLNQILATGRIAYSILLQLPATAKFRNAFLPPKEDWVFVDTDYASAELVIMAYVAQEPSFLEAIRTKKDAHSMSASLLFEEEWKAIAEPGCIHLTTGQKCSCKAHKAKRDVSKTISFGLIYGLSAHGLADRLTISKTEAQALIDKFFTKFPALKIYLKERESFGIANLYIRSLPPTNRIRFFEYPQFESDKGSIGRQSMNFTMQEVNASILKIALIKLDKVIQESQYPVRIHLPVHDEILSSCPRDFADTWKTIQEREMKAAADLFLEPGLLGVESTITDKWTK